MCYFFFESKTSQYMINCESAEDQEKYAENNWLHSKSQSCDG